MDTQRQKKFGKKKDGKLDSIYNKTLITKSISLDMKYVGKQLKSVLEKKTKSIIEGKCIVEGYVKPDSTKIISYSSGVVSSEKIKFDVIVECEVCFPVEGMKINCIARNITKAGIRADSSDETHSPIICFIARDHHSAITSFNAINEGDIFQVRVLGQRFELNDKQISIIGELVLDKKDDKDEKKKGKPTINLLD
tara:strand:+ start:603 stop:1187 length:585 start_codon:yes stop_codon:yes gene_type:complete